MKITMKQAGANLSIKEAFKDFVVAQTAKGVSDKTVETYHAHFRSIGKHLDTSLTSVSYTHLTLPTISRV